MIQLVGEYLFTERTRQEERSVSELAEETGPYYLQADAAELQRIAMNASGNGEKRFLLVDQAGTVQIDSLGKMNGKRLYLKEVAEVLNGCGFDSGIYRIESEKEGADNVLSDLPAGQTACGIYVSGIGSKEAGTVGAAVLLSPADDIYRELISIEKRVYLLLSTVAVSVAILSILMMRRFMKPIADLSEGIGIMTKGDLSSRVKVCGHNEFSELAAAFNAMAERLETLDHSRNQFVSNASHELKTPLATIKLLIESLIYQGEPDPGMTKEFLGDINKEIDRLNSIISDLLSIANIDAGGLKLTVTDISIKEILEDSIKRLMPLARENGIEAEVSIKDKLLTRGDEPKLTQVFYNLIDNAIKYTPRGGRIKVEAVRTGKRAVIRIVDNGIGIPAEDQIHIFERFYRVDKARSRATGGTGLGLSIVKQIVTLHQGEISVVSTEGEGSTFVVELPLVQG